MEEDMIDEKENDVVEFNDIIECGVSREEYESDIYGVYKDFFEEDRQKIIKDAEDMAMEKAKCYLNEKEKEICEKAQRELIEKIRAKRARISENGMMRSGGNSVRKVQDMTKSERAMIARRAANGEIINLK